jgi:hypothetical protein
MTIRVPRSSRLIASFTTLTLGAALVAVACGSDSDEPGAPECTEGEVTCSENGYELRSCQSGKWEVTHCMRDEMKLCENAQCVEPWKYGSPTWNKCEDDPRATPESLREKADGYEEIAKRLHVHPTLKWMNNVTLPCKVVDCPAGQEPPCTDCAEPDVPPDQATYQDVERWNSGENDGLWSALYLTAEAFRYAVTKDPESLAMMNVLLDGQKARMGVTGVPGLYTRQFIPPNIPGLSCPDDLTRYIPDKEKDDNQWVRVGDDGCVQTVDANTMEFVSSTHCGLDAYKGYCWLDNVSQDEYSGHMLSHAALDALVDDPGIQAKNKELLQQIGRHFVDYSFELTDWDGRRTEHGKIWAGNVLSGYMAAMTWGFMKAVVEGTGDKEFSDYIDQCLLLRSDTGEPCIDRIGVATKGYDELIGQSGVFFECRSNWNVFSMHMLSLQSLLLLERDPELREVVQDALTNDMWDNPNTEFPIKVQHNAFWDFIYASSKKLGPESDGPAFEAVQDGLCMLRQFPASQVQRAVDCPDDKCVAACEDRFGDPMTNYVRPMAERCAKTFVWWGSPYDIDDCSENKRVVQQPSGYLLPYWMGRYYGFISESD